MMSYLRSQIECEDFESVLTELGADPAMLSMDEIYSLSSVVTIPESDEGATQYPHFFPLISTLISSSFQKLGVFSK